MNTLGNRCGVACSSIASASSACSSDPGRRTQHSRHRWQGEISSQLGIDARTDEVGEARHRDIHITAPPNETAEVALRSTTASWRSPRPAGPSVRPAGEHRWIPGTAPYTALVDFTTSRANVVDFWQAARSCMVPEDVRLFRRAASAPWPTPTGVTRIDDHRNMHHGVDLAGEDHLDDQWITRSTGGTRRVPSAADLGRCARRPPRAHDRYWDRL